MDVFLWRAECFKIIIFNYLPSLNFWLFLQIWQYLVQIPARQQSARSEQGPALWKTHMPTIWPESHTPHLPTIKPITLTPAYCSSHGWGSWCLEREKNCPRTSICLVPELDENPKLLILLYGLFSRNHSVTFRTDRHMAFGRKTFLVFRKFSKAIEYVIRVTSIILIGLHYDTRML